MIAYAKWPPDCRRIAAVDALDEQRGSNRKRLKLTKIFPKFQKLFKFSVRFQLGSKPIVTSASKLKSIKLNTNIS